MMEDRLVTKWILVASYRVSGDASTIMGAYSSKTTLSGEDMQFLQAKTQLDQASIQVPWHFLHLDTSWHRTLRLYTSWHFLTLNIWHLTLDIWHLRLDTWHLKLALQRFLAYLTHLTPDTWHLCVQEWYEGFLADCPSGELTKDQFVEMYSKIFPSGSADNFSNNIFRTFDTNNSGTIDFRWGNSLLL